ncbi:MAG: encapsulin, partial [Chitinispirillaceae bacterium]
QGNTIELEHLRSLVSGGIIKAPAIREGGVLLATGKQFASIILGQDMMTGFEGPDGRNYTFFISESIALRLSVPSTICFLKSSK